MNHFRQLQSAILSLIVLFAFVAYAQAETVPVATTTVATTSSATSTPKEEPKVVTKTFPRITLAVGIQTRLINLAANVSNRLDALYRRINNVTGRLESRAAKIKVDGKNVEAAMAKITTAHNELTAAHSDLSTIDTAVTHFVGSTDPYESWQTLKITYLSIRDHLKAAHSANVDALLLLQTASTNVAIPAPVSTTTATSSKP